MKLHYVISINMHLPKAEVLKFLGAPPGGGRFWSPRRARVDCRRNIFILNEIWVPGKISILVGALPG
jgi:hypothetical protein